MKKIIWDAENNCQKEVELTQNELDQREIDETNYLAEAPKQQWQAEMQATDNNTSRREEDIIDVLIAKGVLQLTDLAEETQAYYTAKKTKRQEGKDKGFIVNG